MNSTQRFSEGLHIVLELAKFRIALLVCLSTATGYVLASGYLNFNLLLPTIAVFILASGSAALNHYQERDFDLLMKRTSNRPVPSGRVAPSTALRAAVVLVIAGSIALYFSSGFLPLLLGLITVLWYNGVYTPLKRKTPLAVIPGALIGSLPPAIGWSAANGKLLDPFLLIVALFFFVWQIPHFWLLLLKFGDEFEEAGYPTLTSRYSNQQIARFTFFWIIVTVVVSMIIPVFGIGSSIFLYLGLFIVALWLLISSRRLLNFHEEVQTLRNSFIHINAYIMLVMSFLTLDRILQSTPA